MKAKTLIIGLVSTIAAAGAFANEFNGEAFYEKPQPSASSLSRAQVKAELARATAAGELIRSDTDYKYRIAEAVSTRSRAEVHAEVLAAAHNGELVYGDANYKFPHAVSTKSRAEVRAEVSKAASDGTLLRADS
jgi:hypothetical protein